MIKPMFDAALPFCEGLAGVQIGNKFGFIDKSGKLVIKPQFPLVGNFSDGLAPALIPGAPVPVPEGHTPGHSPENDWLTGSKYGFIDKTGTFVIKPEYTLRANSGQRFLTGFMCSDSSGGTCIAARVHPESFDALVSFSEGLAPVQRGAKFGFIDTTGAIVIEAKFDEVSPFSDGLSFVKSGGHSWFIDKKGQTALKPNAPFCEFSEGLAAVEIDAPKKIVQHKSKRK
jgi:hypothetical protein